MEAQRLLMQSTQQQAQQILQQLWQQLTSFFVSSVYSPALLGVVVFIVCLWFFHEFREWRLVTSVVVSLVLAVVLTIAITPLAYLFGL